MEVLLFVVFVSVVAAVLWYQSDTRKDLERQKVERAEQERHDRAMRASREQLLLSIQTNSARIKILAAIKQHRATLTRRRVQTSAIDDYGIEHPEAWYREKCYFSEKVVWPALDTNEQIAVRGARFTNFVWAQVDEAIRSETTNALPSISPRDFEAWCATELSKLGWSVRVTKGSGDQGADVVASKLGMSVALQCKLYSGAVGNAAVQEAFSASAHYGATAAAVVTNAKFTRAARELAATTGVILLHSSELSLLDDLV